MHGRRVARFVAKGDDPRKNAPPPEQVPILLRAGAEEFNAGRFWHAHESWEEAWHALRAAQDEPAAAYVRGMILITAALENAQRDKPSGFRRQFAEGLHALLGHEAAGSRVGIVEPLAWERALCALYADACRRREWRWWRESGWQAPRLRMGPMPMSGMSGKGS